MKEPIAYGKCIRKSGIAVPVYFVYEIEDGKCQIHIKETDEFIDIVECFESLGGRKVNNPNRPLFTCHEA